MGPWVRIPPLPPICIPSVNGSTTVSKTASQGSNPWGYAIYAEIAQLVEHWSEESGVVGSIPTLGTMTCK